MVSLSTSVALLAASSLVSAGGLLPHQIGYGLDSRDNLKRAACNADNCARAVTGTRGPAASSGRADCSSFLQYTYTPPTSTSTVTVTPAAVTMPSTITTVLVSVTTTVATVTVGGSTVTSNVEVFERRQASSIGSNNNTGSVEMPTAVPAYASACSGAARYSSACSCAGVGARTVTAAQPVTTVTVTGTAPVSYAYVAETDVQAVPATATAVLPDTVVVDRIQCGGTLAAPDSGAPYRIVCGAVGAGAASLLASTTLPDWDACVQAADDNFVSNSFTYQLSDGTCNLYQNFGSASSTAPNSDFVYAYFYP